MTGQRIVLPSIQVAGGSVAHTDLDQLRTQSPPEFWLSYAHRFGSVAHTEPRCMESVASEGVGGWVGGWVVGLGGLGWVGWVGG